MFLSQILYVDAERRNILAFSAYVNLQANVVFKCVESGCKSQPRLETWKERSGCDQTHVQRSAKVNNTLMGHTFWLGWPLSPLYSPRNIAHIPSGSCIRHQSRQRVPPALAILIYCPSYCPSRVHSIVLSPLPHRCWLNLLSSLVFFYLYKTLLTRSGECDSLSPYSRPSFLSGPLHHF